MGLSETAARGAFQTVGGQLIRFLVQFASLVVLSRLLTPTDYGIITMVTAVVGVALALSDFGLSLAAVQKVDITEPQKANLLWINIGFSTVIALLVVLAAPFLADFYDQPQVTDVARWLAPVFLLTGIAAQFRAELNRNLRFGKMVLVDTGAQLAGTVAAIIAALLGAGYWSLVILQLGVAFLQCVGFIVVSRWRPGLPSRRADMGGLLKFGASTMGTQSINYVSSNADSIAIGRFWGADELGVYGRAFQLFNLPLQQLAAPMTRVAVPVLSRLVDDVRFVSYVVRAQKTLSYTLLICLGFLSGAAPLVLSTALGSQWVSGAPLLQLLTIGGVFQTLGYTYYWVYLARSSTRTLLVCEGVGRAVMIVLVVVGALHSTAGAAIGYSAGLFTTWLISGAGLSRTGFNIGPLVRASIAPVALSLTLAVQLFALVSVLQSLGLNHWIAILICGGEYLLLAAVACAVIPALRRDVKVLIATAKSARRT
jgi:O-antigen/teichoic acid export membrane protein